jgi:Xaa-Pro aminopeptidase
MKRIAIAVVLFVFVSISGLQGAEIKVLTHREQYPIQRAWIEKRFNTVLPELMRREGIDMWIVVSREYNDDPVFRSMAPLTTFSSRRRTILVFFDPGPGKPVERLSIGRFDYDKLYQMVAVPIDEQWSALRRVVGDRKPKTIGINMSEFFNHADGLTATEKQNLENALGPDFSKRLKSAERLAVGWLELKIAEEYEGYRQAMKVAHAIIAEAFSNDVVTPGKTTNEDVAWWMRQRVANLGLGSWFHPSVTIHRKGGTNGDNVIRPGDMLHTDFGLVYLGFSTDTQHNAYVLRPGETEAPAGLQAGLAAANRLQDLVWKHAPAGATGNQALAGSLREAKAAGMVPSVYCHAIGYHGHGAGTPIGMTDRQDGVPGRGDYVIRPNSWYSIELNVTHPVPEWNNQAVRFALEEDAAILPSGWQWVDGRQTSFYLIK